MTEHRDARSHSAFDEIDHRPWTLPDGRWAWRQSWRDLLFAHWPVPIEAVRPLVPYGLEAQAFDGTAWVGVVPFRMAGVMRRPLPDMPWVSAFPELNVRVYVEAGGKPGVWFLSLDATNPLVVAVARAVFHLPYYRARMSIAREGEWFAYECVRQGKDDRRQTTDHRQEGAVRRPPSVAGGEPALFRGRYRPTSSAYSAAPGTLEHWLTERYCLYAQGPDGMLYRTEVHHRPWPLQRAEAEISANSVSAAGGLPVSGPPALLHFARRIDVVVWGSREVGQ